VLIDQVDSRTTADDGTGLALRSMERNPALDFGILAAGVLVLGLAWVRRWI
jgi:hypothetical protein